MLTGLNMGDEDRGFRSTQRDGSSLFASHRLT